MQFYERRLSVMRAGIQSSLSELVIMQSKPGRSDDSIFSVQLDGTQLRLEPGQIVIPRGSDRHLTVAEALPPAGD